MIRDRTGAPVYAYRKTTATKAKRQTPEADLQVQVNRFLKLTLPPDVKKTASLSGAHLGHSQRALAAAMGLERGWPDLQFLVRRRTYYIELKAPITVRSRTPERYGTLDDPDLSPEQRDFLSLAHPDCWVICRSIEQVRDTLLVWGVELRPHTIR